MAVGGFKVARYSYLTSGTNMSTNTSEERTKLVKNIVIGIANCIISTNQGWSYDSDIIADSSNDENCIYTLGLDNTYGLGYCTFLKHTTSNTKLCVLYSYCSSSSSNYLDYNAYIHNNAEDYRGYGLCMSIIPYVQSESYNWTIEDKKLISIPEKSKFICSCYESKGTYSPRSFIYDNGTFGITNSWTIVVKQDTIFVFYYSSPKNSDIKGFMIGKIFENISYNSDRSDKLYGQILFSDATSSYSETSDAYSTLVNNSFKLPNRLNLYYRDDGTVASDYNMPDKQYTTEMFCTNTPAVYGSSSNPLITNKTTFGAIGCYLQCSDLAQTGITSTSGMKGYLDTDAIRCVYYGFPQNTLFDGGNFIYVGGGIAVGWDPSNVGGI